MMADLIVRMIRIATNHTAALLVSLAAFIFSSPTQAQDTTPPIVSSSVYQNGLITVRFSEPLRTNDWLLFFSGSGGVGFSNPRWDSKLQTFFLNVSGTNGATFGFPLSGLKDVAGNSLRGIQYSYVGYEFIAANVSPRPYTFVNSTLTCTVTTPTPTNGTVSYQWQRNGTNLSAATSSSYRATLAGSYRAMVTYTDWRDLSKSVIATASTTVVSSNATRQIYLQNTNGDLAAWHFYGTNFMSSSSVSRKIESGWQMAAQADFNRDGQIDFLWQKGTNLTQWLMNGPVFLRTNKVNYFVPIGALIASSKDFNFDGQNDFLQHKPTDNSVSLIRMTNSSVTLLGATTLRKATTGWKPVLVGDFAGDSLVDLIWQNTVGTNRQVVAWHGISYTNTASMLGGAGLPSGWNIVGGLDLNNDNQKDLLLQDTGGHVALWLMNRTARTAIIYPRGPSFTLPAGGWKIVGPK